MALRPCPECNTEVSTKAKVCPKCGSPLTAGTRVGKATAIGVGLFAVLLVISIVGKDDQASTGSTAAPAPPESATIRKERESLLAELRGLGVFGKIDCRTVGADAWVQPAFYAMDFDAKQSFAGVVYAHCFGRHADSGVVVLRDHLSGKKVGSFSRLRGLEME